MYLLDFNFTMFGATSEDYDFFYDTAMDLGGFAWASESQFYLLTPIQPDIVYEALRSVMLSGDFLKVAEIRGYVRVGGLFPPEVNTLFEHAHRLGLITLSTSTRAALPAPSHPTSRQLAYS